MLVRHVLNRVTTSLLSSRNVIVRCSIKTRNFRSSHCVLTKQFVDSENLYAHNVLKQSLKPYQLFRLEPEKDVMSTPIHEVPGRVLETPQVETSSDELFKDFCSLSRYCRHTGTCISDARFSAFLQAYCENTQKLSDAQVIETLRHMTLLPTEESVKVDNYITLWNTLDVECCRRIENWNNNELLLLCDTWYTLNLARISAFVSETLRKLGRKARKLNPEQMVQTLFLCNVLRRPIYEMIDFEVNMLKYADNMTLQELSIMAMGFFKTQTPIRNPEMIEYLYKRLLPNLDTVEDITLVAILKVLRYSSKLQNVESMMQLMRHLCVVVDRISLLSCLHMALLGCELQSCNDELIERILQRYSCDIAQARLKDMERICLVISLFNIRTASGVEKDVCAKILQLLPAKIDEILKYPRCFPRLLHFMSLNNYFDIDMISTALSEKFLRHAYGKNLPMGREIFHLDSFVKINLKDSNYEGNQLPEKYRRTMGKMYTNYIPERKYKLNATDRVLMEVKDTTDSIMRPNAFKHILPQYERADIVICYDHKQHKAIPISPTCPEDYSGTILTRRELLGEMDNSDVTTVAIIVLGWNNVVRELNRHTGLFDMKLKQLQILGYKCIIITWYEWGEMENQTDRLNFLKRRLAKAIKL